MQRSKSGFYQAGETGDDVVPINTTQSAPDIYGESPKTNSADWAEFYKLLPEYTSGLEPALVALQHEIHHLISTEENYVKCTRVFIQVFGNGLSDTLSDAPKNTFDSGMEKFRQRTFVSLEHVLDLNDKFLLKALKEEQGRNGPFLTFPSAAFMDWAQLVREPILWYAECYPHASETVRVQSKVNPRFKAFLEHGSVESMRKVGKEFSALFENTRTRFGQYSLILKTMQKQIRKIDSNDPQIAEINEIMDIISGTMLIYNEIQGRIGDEIQTTNLDRALYFKNKEDYVDLQLLNFEKMPHRIEYRSEVMFKRSEIDFMEKLEMILLDHYLLLVSVKSDTNYHVTTKPIHLELLAIESGADDPMFKSSAKAVVNRLSRNKSEAHSHESRRGTVSSITSLTSPLSRDNSISGENGHFVRRSIGGMSEYSSGGGGFLAPNNDMIYPIKLRNLATDQKYYICTTSEITRSEWMKRIVAAKERYSERAVNLNLDPLSLRVLDCTYFGYVAPEKTSMLTKGNPVQVAFSAVSQHTAGLVSSSTPKSYGVKQITNVNCALEIFSNGMRLMLLGLDCGVYGCQVKSPGLRLNWKKLITLQNVTRLEAVVERNSLFILSEKTLLAYKLHEIILGSIETQTALAISPPITVSTAVDCFKAGILDGNPYVFHSVFSKKSTVTVLKFADGTPNKRQSGLFSFRNKTIGKGELINVDSLFTPTENSHIEFFNKTFCIYTANSFEIMDLKHQRPESVPIAGSISALANKNEISVEYAEELRKQISLGRPIHLAKFQKQPGPQRPSFNILCYHKFALICNAYGDLASAKLIRYQVHKIQAARLWYPYLITFSSRVIEVYKLTGGADVFELVQVITGRRIKLLDSSGDGSGARGDITGGSGVGTKGLNGGEDGRSRIIFSMAHPQIPTNQAILEMQLNDTISRDQRMNSLAYIQQ